MKFVIYEYLRINSAAYGRARFVLEKYSVYAPFIFAFAAGMLSATECALFGQAV